MKNHQHNLLRIYLKRKEGMQLTVEEQRVWKQWRETHPPQNEASFDEESLCQLTWSERQVLPWEQFKEKYGISFPIAYPTEKHQATVRVSRLGGKFRRLAVAASLLLLVMAGWWWWPDNKAVEGTTATTAESTLLTPGSTKATLYLADHRAIALDTVVKGTFAQQANTQVATWEPGVLQYKYIAAQQPAGSLQEQHTLQVPIGGEYKIELADGTKVWLNAASTFRYPVAVGNSARMVHLEEGEAYFEVAKKSPAQPFIVLVKGQRIEVLGTQFNVSAYKEEPAVTTTLVEGSVWVTNGKQQSWLRPGQQAVMQAKGIAVRSVTRMEAAIAWKNKFFSFRNTRLSIIMAQVKRWYDVEEVVYNDPLNDEQFVIDNFPRSAPLKSLLDHLEASKSVRFEVKGRKIFISKQ